MENPTRYYSKMMEEDVARQLGGNVVANSGATLMYKGDVRTNDILVECKTVTKPQTGIRLEKPWIDKIRQEAFEQGKRYGVVAVRFEPKGKNYYVIPETLMQLLIEYMGADNR